MAGTKRHYNGLFCGKFRYFILFLGWLCLASISSNMLALNFTLICMEPPPHGNNGTQIDGKGKIYIDFSSQQKSQLMWAVAFGSMFGTFPFSMLYTRFGARLVLFAAGLISILSTALIPLAATQFDFGIMFLAIRFLQGIAYSADFSAMGMICSRWASLKQNALFISVLTCYSPLSTTITNPISGIICESQFGWPMVYYAHSLACLFLFLLWLYFYNDHPRQNHFVTEEELEKINRGKTKAHIEMDPHVPYKAILSNRLVWVIWLNAFADLFSGMFLLMYIPTYFKSVLHFGIEKTGFLGALPSLAHMPLKFLFGYSSDKFKCLPERTKMIIFNTIAVGLPGFAYLLLGFVPDDQPLLAVFTFTAILMFFSTAGGGFYKCGTLCTRQYSHFVVANIQFVKCLTLFVGPVLIWLFVEEEGAREQWRNIFLIMAIMLFMANLLFTWVATDQPAEFTKIGNGGEIRAGKEEEGKVEVDEETTKMMNGGGNAKMDEEAKEEQMAMDKLPQNDAGAGRTP